MYGAVCSEIDATLSQVLLLLLLLPLLLQLLPILLLLITPLPHLLLPPLPVNAIAVGVSVARYTTRAFMELLI